MLVTRITETYGLTVPILSAGMAFPRRPQLAAAVSNAGGMGFLGADLATPEELAEMILATRALTTKPFGLDFLTPFFTPQHLEVVCSHPVSTVVFFWDTPAHAWVDRLHAAGVRVWMQVSSVKDALDAVTLGLDALIVQGAEAGGYTRTAAGLMSLLPAIADAVAPVPVIAAGGIADGCGLAAALMLGAEAVRCGTRFLASEEANGHVEYQRRMLEAIAAGSAHGEQAPGAPATPSPPAPAQAATAPIGRAGTPVGYGKPGVRHPIGSRRKANADSPDLSVSESPGTIRPIRPAADIVRKMAQDGEQILSRCRARARQLHERMDPGLTPNE